MRLTHSWTLSCLGSLSIVAVLSACGDVTEPFSIIGAPEDAAVGEDAGDGATTGDARPPLDANDVDATVTDAGDANDVDATVTDAGDAGDAGLVDATVADAGLVDATVTDAGLVDAGRDTGVAVPDGGTVVVVNDAQVVIPPLDPRLLGDSGITATDAGLAAADGGALTPRQFRDLVNGITCQRASECCCPGCSAAELATPGAGFSQSKCMTGLSSSGLQRVLFGNESIPAGNLVANPTAMARCLAVVNQALLSCRSISADSVRIMRTVCLDSYNSNLVLGSACTTPYQCQMPARCAGAVTDAGADAGKTCQALVSAGGNCVSSTECTPRGMQGTPPLFCNLAAQPSQCTAFRAGGEVCTAESDCGFGTCLPAAVDGGVRVCSSTLPFASQDTNDNASFCKLYTP